MSSEKSTGAEHPTGADPTGADPTGADPTGPNPIRTVRRVLPAAVAAVLTAGLVVSAQLLPVEAPGATGQPVPTVGRQLTVCPVDRSAGDRTRLGAVVADGLSAGRLVGTELADSADTADPVVDLDQAGSADQASVTGSVLLRSEGGFSDGAAGTVLTTTSTGPGQGIALAGCQPPSTQHWFTGVAASATQTTRLVLTNPDSAEATVDLHFFGPDGAIGAPGSLGIVVPASTTKSVSLTGLLPGEIDGPVAAQVTTSQGRVSAYAQSTYRASLQPAGDGVASSMPAPQSSLVIPGVPGGDGDRSLVLANPTDRRTTVTVEVMGADGTFAPADGATIDVNAQSTTTADLADALDGEAVAIRLTSPQSITAAVVSTSSRSGAAADVAVQTPTTAIRGARAAGVRLR